MMCLRDPADETNDLGRKGIAIKHILVTFRNLEKKLSMDLARDTRDSFLKPLVGDAYALNKARRIRLESVGREVLSSMNNSLSQTAQAIRDADAPREWEAVKKLAETPEKKPRTGLDDYGDAVISVLGMPDVEDLEKGELEKDALAEEGGSAAYFAKDEKATSPTAT
jgi:non-canonical poly(A) RNA polymerase PAPD5/7